MGMRIATPVCGLVRNDTDFGTIRIKLGAESMFSLSLRGGMQRIPTWQSVFLYISNYNLSCWILIFSLFQIDFSGIVYYSKKQDEKGKWYENPDCGR